MYMQMKTGRWEEGFCKNTYYRFLNSLKVNWERFCLLPLDCVLFLYDKNLRTWHGMLIRSESDGYPS